MLERLAVTFGRFAVCYFSVEGVPQLCDGGGDKVLAGVVIIYPPASAVCPASLPRPAAVAATTRCLRRPCRRPFA